MTAAAAEIHRNPGSTTPLPHQKYIHVVSEADSPIQQTYIKSKDGLYIAAAIRKPKGDGRYPAMIMFHGAPGGRGMEQLAGWSRGDHGGPVWERFLQEGYVVVVADYRGGEHGYHDFCLGPQGQKRTDLPQGEALLDSALDALEKSVLFVKGKLK